MEDTFCASLNTYRECTKGVKRQARLTLIGVVMYCLLPYETIYGHIMLRGPQFHDDVIKGEINSDFFVNYFLL